MRDDSTEPMIQRNTALQLPGAARAAQTIQAQSDIQDTMKTLADQLLVLFDELPSAGLIRQQRRAMKQHVQTYFRIADGVWEALATDQLYELAGNRGYTVAVDTLEQKLIQIHETCEQVKQNPKARGGWLWRRRVKLYSQSLLEWKRCLDSGPGGGPTDATTCGRVLYRAHGRVGLAGISGFDHLLILALPTLGILASLLLALVYGAIGVVQGIQGNALVPTAIASLIALYILWFSTAGPSPLPIVVGYALGRRQPAIFTRLLRGISVIDFKPGLLRRFLRALLTILGTLLLAGLIALLALSIFFARAIVLDMNTGVMSSHGALATLLQSTPASYVSLDPGITAILLPVLCLGIIAIFFLPFTLTVQARMTRALLAYPSRSPEARRYALRPAMELLSFHTITLFFIAVLAISLTNFGAASLLPASLPPVSGRFIIYVLAIGLPYLLLIDLPYRRGIARWRATRLYDLLLRRNEIARRLSRITPQPVDQNDMRVVQDYLTWQYYRTLEGEAKETPTAPFSIEGRILALALTILIGILLDQINQVLHGLL